MLIWLSSVYQNYLCKNITNKYSTLSVHLDKVIAEANSELTNLQNKVSSTSKQNCPNCSCINTAAGLSLDQDTLIRKNEELAQAFKEKSRKLLQTQELYDKLKRKAMLGQMQDAASEAIDSTIQAATAAATGTGLGDLAHQWPDGQQTNISQGDRQHLDNPDYRSINNNLSQVPFDDLRDGGWNRPSVVQSRLPEHLIGTT